MTISKKNLCLFSSILIPSAAIMSLVAITILLLNNITNISATTYQTSNNLKIPTPVNNPANLTAEVKGVVYYVGMECPPTVQNRTPPCSGPYPDHPVIVYSGKDRTTVATTKTDDTGKYRFLLQPGNFTIYTPGGSGPSALQTISFIVKAKQILVLDLHVDAGVR